MSPVGTNPLTCKKHVHVTWMCNTYVGYITRMENKCNVEGGIFSVVISKIINPMVGT